MRRVGRPPLDESARQLIAIRVDADVLDAFQKEARKRRVGYQTLIYEILAEHARGMSHRAGKTRTSVWNGTWYGDRRTLSRCYPGVTPAVFQR